jgi:hypothetical protein
MIVFFDPLGHRPENWEETQIKVWSFNLKAICPCFSLAGGEVRDEAFTQAASVLSAFLSNQDLVPSDILCGFLLMRARGKLRRDLRMRRLRDEALDVASRGNVALDLASRGDQVLLSEISYYYRYAEAAYGWPYYIYSRCGNACSAMFCNGGMRRTGEELHFYPKGKGTVQKVITRIVKEKNGTEKGLKVDACFGASLFFGLFFSSQSRTTAAHGTRKPS